ncbi:MAG: 1-acyl-sn-glycerol-3-phosphate acyltransferase [Elusimicrobia bacterium]|nr:1-acyl-sn-glycerol-3-phosphate acyltransferase [Elusimicrobiota bacterium]
MTRALAAEGLAWLCRAVCGVSVQWLCDPFARTQRVYFANHTSHLDAVLIWGCLPHCQRRRTHPVAARDYWDAAPVRRWLSEAFGAVLIDRGSISSRRNPLDDMERALGNEDSLILFPEGTRGDGPDCGRFHSGLYHLAMRRNCLEFIPVHLRNLNRIMPKGEFLPVPLISQVTFGPSMRAEPGVAKTAFLDGAKDALESLSQP